MGKKYDFFSCKAVANRQKAKGLNKLRWYCQMCQKSCRDENGFKCHKTSEAHQRNMNLYSNNPGAFTGVYSKDFHHNFMNLFKLQGGLRVLANSVYREYIKDRHHVHMNSTCWSSLTGYINHLGRQGIAKVEKAEKIYDGKVDWWITYIERNPVLLRKKSKLEKTLRIEEKDRKRAEQKAEEQRKRAIKMIKPIKQKVFKKLLKKEILKFELKQTLKQELKMNYTLPAGFLMKKKVKQKKHKLDSFKFQLTKNKKHKRKTFFLKKKKILTNIKQFCWLKKNCILKIKHRTLSNGIYLEKKCKVMAINKIKFTSKLNLNKTKILFEITQNNLQTVIPKNSTNVIILSGAFKNKIGLLRGLDINTFSGIIQIKDIKEMIRVPFEWFTKFIL